jgi:DNA-binding transcriptional LysR family regulator
MSLKRLSYFLRIAELGSMSRASEALHIAQPALTRQIHILEQELGISLFTRTARGMQLTPEGEQLQTDIMGPLRQLEFAFQKARLLSGKPESNISLGMPPSVRYALAQPLTRRVIQAEPSIKMRIVEGHLDHLIEWLVAGKIDMALLFGSPSDDRIIHRGIILEDLMLVGSIDSGLYPDRSINFKELSKFPLFISGSRNGIISTLEKSAYLTKTNIKIIQQVDSFELIKDLVISGEG